MKKVTDYQVVTAVTLGLLQDKVKALLKAGWQPIGGLVTIGDHTLSQTMVK